MVVVEEVEGESLNENLSVRDWIDTAFCLLWKEEGESLEAGNDRRADLLADAASEVERIARQKRGWR